MNNAAWTPEELADLTKPYHLFQVLHPNRSDSAYRHKRFEILGPAIEAPIFYAKDDTDRIFVSGDGSEEKDDEQEVSDEELFNATVKYQSVSNRAFPKTLHHTVKVTTQQPIAIAFMSDWHIGSEGCDLERIRTDCQLIASHPQLYVALGGDPVDNFILSKMASAARTQIAQVQVQWRLFRYLAGLVQDSLLWVSAGNHDAWTQRAAGIDGILAALADIPVCYTKEGGFIHLQVGKQTYVVYRKHRPTRFSSQLNQTHFLKQMLRMGTPIEFDVGISEHLHEADLEVFEYRPGSKIDRVLITCGSYKVKDTYAEDIGFYGGGYGVPTVIFYPDRRKMMPFMSIQDALDALDGVSSDRAA